MANEPQLVVSKEMLDIVCDELFRDHFGDGPTTAEARAWLAGFRDATQVFFAAFNDWAARATEQPNQ